MSKKHHDHNAAINPTPPESTTDTAATAQPSAPPPDPEPSQPEAPPPPTPPTFSETLARHADAIALNPSDLALIDTLITHLPNATTEDECIEATRAALYILSSPKISLPRRQIRPLARTAAHHLLTLSHLPQSSTLSTLLATILSLPQ